MQISESINNLIEEYKAISDSDTNEEYNNRLMDSMTNPNLNQQQHDTYVKHVKKLHPNRFGVYSDQNPIKLGLKPSDYHKLELDSVSLDRANIAKHNNELYDNHITPAAALIKRISKAASEHSGGIAAGAGAGVAVAGLLGAHLLKNKFSKTK